MSNEKILVVEDDAAIRELIVLTLEGAGYANVFAAADGEEALESAARNAPDLVLLDLMLPGIDGLAVCRRLKRDDATASIPIIMLTARSDESDIVIGLEIGADDYITKPFSRKILIARIRARLRQNSDNESSGEIRYGGVVINDDVHTVRLNGEALELTLSEFELLKLFAAHPGRVFTRNQIINRLKGGDYPVTERAIDVQIVNLRRKLGVWGGNVETVRGVGYRLKGGL